MTRLYQTTHKSLRSLNTPFFLEDELKMHGWHPAMTLFDAELALEGQPSYTYLIRPSDIGRGFAISFVQPSGYVKHDYFRLINPKYGIFINGIPSHVGRLEKVIRDMMNCPSYEGIPL